jgi:Protein of unknown function (DUF3990)
MLFAPARWTNAPIRLYHGTVLPFAEMIIADGVRISTGRPNTDFGPGFYTTTLERQAQYWAYQLGQKHPGEAAAVVAVDVGRDKLAALDTLAFVRGDFHAEDFWSFVVHCRSGAGDHRRAHHPDGLYDLVVGPVASFWQQRVTMDGADQVSFHTPTAEIILNSSPRFLSWTSSH